MNGFDDRKYIGMLGQGICDCLEKPKLIESLKKTFVT
jgi:hypothetical protein